MRASLRFGVAVALLPVATGVASQPPARERVICSIGDTAERPCVYTTRIDARGMHHMTFRTSRGRAVFIGRAQSGWWSGRLNGKLAMGYERNRGNMVFSTYDLSTRLSWWYPRDAHGTY